VRSARSLAKRSLPYAAVAAATFLGLGLMVDSLWRSSATYDEVAYLQIASDWWRTGRQERITRMGSPLTFWKLQHAPVLWGLDRTGYGSYIDDPIAHQAALLPIVRTGALWIWVVALGLTAAWARWQFGPWAMAFAAWWFALSPNLLAHGALVTMELPLLAASTGMFLLFGRFLETGRMRSFLASAVVAGLAFSCKFTTVVFVPILGLAWWLERVRLGQRAVVHVGLAMLGFGAILAATDFLITGGAVLPMSGRQGGHPSLEAWDSTGSLSRLVELPLPQDWVAFSRQMQHQRSGGPSYLFGQRRMTGWWYYAFVCLAVKVPLSFWIVMAARGWLTRKRLCEGASERLIATTIVAFLTIVALGSARNYGFRYLLPLAPLAIVWLSAIAEWGKLGRSLALAGLVGQGTAVAACHPYELSYFPMVVGGPRGGRHVLADSNLDWGQGARLLAELQARRPEFRDLTLYYFGDTDPGYYGVVGTRYLIDASDRHPALPPQLEPRTRFLGVSTSLLHGPWGPVGYFDGLRTRAEAYVLEDGTMSLFSTAAGGETGPQR
jgi:hypothetical protein